MAHDLGTRIRIARRRSAITQAQLAALLGVGRSAVGNWEAATGVAPASERLAAIATATGVSYEWLATGRGVPDLAPAPAALSGGEIIHDPEVLRLLRAFRGCTQAIRRALLQFAEAGVVGMASVAWLLDEVLPF